MSKRETVLITLLTQAYQALKRQNDMNEPYSTHEQAEAVINAIEKSRYIEAYCSTKSSLPEEDEYLLLLLPVKL